MKYLVLAGLVMAAWSCTSTDKPSSVADANRDSIAKLALKDTSRYTTVQWLDSVRQDLGKIKKGQQVEVAWELKNTGDAPLVITRFEPTCGCTVSEPPREPIMPGKTITLKAVFNSSGQSVGEHDKTLLFEANMKPSTSAQLGFHVNVIDNESK